jgi:hypothetical protein
MRYNWRNLLEHTDDPIFKNIRMPKNRKIFNEVINIPILDHVKEFNHILLNNSPLTFSLDSKRTKYLQNDVFDYMTKRKDPSSLYMMTKDSFIIYEKYTDHFNIQDAQLHRMSDPNEMNLFKTKSHASIVSYSNSSNGSDDKYQLDYVFIHLNDDVPDKYDILSSDLEGFGLICLYEIDNPAHFWFLSSDYFCPSIETSDFAYYGGHGNASNLNCCPNNIDTIHEQFGVQFNQFYKDGL